jgi:hypothetical protein
LNFKFLSEGETKASKAKFEVSGKRLVLKKEEYSLLVWFSLPI